CDELLLRHPRRELLRERALEDEVRALTENLRPQHARDNTRNGEEHDADDAEPLRAKTADEAHRGRSEIHGLLCGHACAREGPVPARRTRGRCGRLLVVLAHATSSAVSCDDTISA